MRGSIVTSLKSGNETLVMTPYVKCPDSLFKFPDLVYDAIHSSLIA